ncbi:family 10 glycosylhydrolase [Catalinimonas niigatensis]|uniref:family 10 glycosylhydrolase n=1 Tax=Catalinimonas niigatensis TaxID=1397264 RepID=UPI002664EF22|nr:family 10 glycosylhydrolase [Catalinimonas niigatensis]WPP51442.1 family 10 glycosylhydrolase [Catalinimonas niigatensis]
MQMIYPKACIPVFLGLLFTSFVHGQENVKQTSIRGIYGNPAPLWEKGYRLDELGVNAIFVHSGSIDRKMMERAKAEGMQVFAEYATLNGKNYVEEHPEAWAINEKGEKVEAASWFMGVCPTEPGFRQYRFNALRELLQTYALDGVWMDYVHWHAQFEDPEPILPETCFNEHCLSAFQEAKGIQLPEGSIPEKAQWILDKHEKVWRDWRCEVIADWTREIRKIVKEERPDALLGLYHCPWNDEAFNSARRRILGLDYDLLKDYVDVFSPMVYHAKMGRPASWVAENIQWFSQRLELSAEGAPLLWPIVQAHDDPYTISPKEFQTVLEGGLSAASSGVMMFTTHSVAEDEGKIQVMKSLYQHLK